VRSSDSTGRIIENLNDPDLAAKRRKGRSGILPAKTAASMVCRARL